MEEELEPEIETELVSLLEEVLLPVEDFDSETVVVIVGVEEREVVPDGVGEREDEIELVLDLVSVRDSDMEFEIVLVSVGVNVTLDDTEGEGGINEGVFETVIEEVTVLVPDISTETEIDFVCAPDTLEDFEIVSEVDRVSVIVLEGVRVSELVLDPVPVPVIVEEGVVDIVRD